ATRSAGRTAASPPSSRGFGSRTASSSGAAAITGRSGATTPSRRSPSPPATWTVRSVARVAGATAGSVAAVCVLLAATGWLYLIRPYLGAGGPRVGDALPLDELSRHGAVPLLPFVAVWSAAALALALLARAARLERLTAATLLALGTAGWAYLETGVSILT